MNQFTIVDDAYVILREKGIFKQAKVYRLGDRLFAGYGSNGFIGLLANEGTTAPNTSWSHLDTPFPRALKEGRIVAVTDGGAS